MPGCSTPCRWPGVRTRRQRIRIRWRPAPTTRNGCPARCASSRRTWAKSRSSTRSSSMRRRTSAPPGGRRRWRACATRKPAGCTRSWTRRSGCSNATARSWGTWARWWTRAWCSSTTPAPGRAGTGCWKPSGSTPPGSWRRGARRAAIAFSLTRVGDPVPGLRLAAALRMFWRARGHAAEGADALRALLDLPAARAATLPRARALAAAADLLEHTGGYATAGEYCQEALAIARAAGDDYLVADLLHLRASVLLHQGQQDTALPLIESALDLACHLDDPHLTGRLLTVRGFALDLEGDHAG